MCYSYFFHTLVNNSILSFFADHASIALVEVVESYEVYIGARTGTLQRPSHEQLNEVFGTHKFEDIFEFMSTHGQLKHSGKHTSLENEDKG